MLSSADLYRGQVLIDVQQSAATAATNVVWALLNPAGSGRKIAIERIFLEQYFDIGGTAVATLMKYEIIKGAGVTAFSGGASVTPLHKTTSLASGAVAQARVLDTGLTVTGVAWAGIGLNLEHSRVLATSTVPLYKSAYLFEYPRLKEIELEQGEILAIRLLAAAVIKDTLKGSCDYSEKILLAA